MKSRLPINALLTPKQLEEVKAFAHEIAQEEFERLNKPKCHKFFRIERNINLLFFNFFFFFNLIPNPTVGTNSIQM